MSTINKKKRDDRNEDDEGEGESGGAARVGETTSAGMQPPPAAPTRRDQQRNRLPESLVDAGSSERLRSSGTCSSDASEMLRKQRVKSLNAKKKGMLYKNPMQKKKKSSTGSDTPATM